MAIKSWIAAARLRTLPLAFSCILLGSTLASADGRFSWTILGLALLTTLLYQVLSNYANDYGDGVKGTDDHRQGEKRAVASGEISVSAMRRAVVLFSVLAWISGAWLSYLGTRELDSWVFYLFLILNTGAVSSAIRYTVGGSAYGYKGFGDVYVLIFFGWVGVLGSYFLQTRSIDPWVILPASSIGMLAMGVLNLNNMRDLENDKVSGKVTVPVRLGLAKAKKYHSILILGAILTMAVYVYTQSTSLWGYAFVVWIPFLLVQWQKALRAESPSEFDPLLKPLAIGTLLFAVITGISMNLHLWL